jgi:SAM-dependent methyltransferase
LRALIIAHNAWVKFSFSAKKGHVLSIEIKTINANKAAFDDIYIAPDPRQYFSVLGSLNYMIPDVAEPVLRQILAAKAAMHGASTVLDIGCSYGINAATHRFPVNFTSLLQRYARREMMDVLPDTLIDLDKKFYASWPDIGAARFIGFDISPEAIHYASRTGLHDAGVVADLENNDLMPEQVRTIAPANVLLSTGSVGYVTHRTYRKLMDVVGDRAWAISFVLRMFPYDDFITAFAERGMVTEKLTSATFVQRRFRDEDEFSQCLASMEKRGLDTAGFEAEGLFHAELFLSRPKADAEAAPLEEIVTVSSGRYSKLGARYVRVGSHEDERIAIET